jgi:hypothetical protein
MPTGHPWTHATIPAVQSASVLRELGLVGALSLATASVVKFAHHRAAAEAPVEDSANPRFELNPRA